MYSVLLVDDEPLILSGIRHMLNWEQEGFRVIGSARSGKQALEIIGESQPDIVVCDINMPGMSGLELLHTASMGVNPPAFVMLTNHGEFDMARIALQHKAVDYLLKSQLNEESFLAAMMRAKAFCEQREVVRDVQAAQSAAPQRREIANSVARLLEQGMEGERAAESIETLRKANALNGYAWLQIVLDYSTLPDLETYAEEDLTRVYDSIREIIDTLAARVLAKHISLFREEAQSAITMYSWDIDAQRYDDLLQILFSQITASCSSFTPARLCLLATSCLCAEQQLGQMLKEKKELRRFVYLFNDELIKAPVSLPTLSEISPEELCKKLVPALRAKNAQQFAKLINDARTTLSEVPHTRRNGIEYCAQLYSTAATLLAPMFNGKLADDEPSGIADTIRKLNRFVNRTQLLGWLDSFERTILLQLEQLNSDRPALVEEVRSYVEEHIDKQIKLQDVAQHVSMAPSYLSTTFRKLYGKTLFDYINEVKIRQACSYLENHSHKIYEISYLLGYENAYYFTRVFKRYIGITPREYQAKFINKA